MASRALLKDKEPSEASPMAAGIEGRISPSVLLAIVAVAAVFFIISGLIHLLVRCLLRPPRRDLEDELDGITVLQGQLQQLFHLHDAGVDQSFIDALPVFIYSNVSGSKEASFDCAVCLCEFEPEDRLRLLPRCSHAFHLQCIDTWLLAHSTCPLCRGSLVLDHCPAPAALVLEPSCESFREIATGRGDSSGRGHQEVEESRTYDDAPRKAGEDGPKVETVSVILSVDAPPPPRAVFLPVKLGKFRNVDAGAGGGGEENSLRGSSVDERRCFSMGSFEYVMNETTPLRIAIRPPSRNTGAKRPGHRPAVPDFDGGRSEGLGQFHPTTTAVASEMEDSGGDAENGARSRRAESLSISNGWLRAMKENAAGVEGGWRRAFSFRLPLQQWRASLPETETSWTEKRGVELELELECAEYGSRVVSRAEETPSFARRTMQWIAGKRRKVVNHA